MCLITKQTKPRITTKDRVVYKSISVYDDVVSSYFQNFVWEENKVMKQPLGIELNAYTENGLECYDGTCWHKYMYEKDSTLLSLTAISEGFHACTTKKRLSSHTHIGKFIIPKGSEIFTDATGCIVSNKMMFIKQIK